jgi:ribosome biogenesis GTPase
VKKKKHVPRKLVRKRSWSADDADAPTKQSRSTQKAMEGERPLFDEETYFTVCDTNGVVVSPYGLLAFVEWEGTEHLCRVDSQLTDGKTSWLAPGDRVRVEHAEDEPAITAVAPRESKLSRPAIGRSREQVLAANIGRIVIVVSAKRPAFNPGLVDRYLIAAEMGGVQPILCVNKMDLVSEPPTATDVYQGIGLPIVYTSCMTGDGLEELRGALAGHSALLTGQSGVGKSSIINYLEPDLDLATQEISDNTRKGRHTTTSSRLYHLKGDIHLIDTPGIKQLGLWGLSIEELSHYFPEIMEHASGCRFRDCSHIHEPGCAVREALESGALNDGRYQSYLRIRKSLDEKY